MHQRRRPRSDPQPTVTEFNSRRDIATYHVGGRTQFTCSNGQTEAACTGGPAGSVQTGFSYKELQGDTGGPLLWAEIRSTRLGTYGDDREATTDYVLKADPNIYLLRPLTTTHSALDYDTRKWVMFAKTAQTWDPSYRVPLTTETWVDDVDANRAIARTEYDMATGNVLRRWKPEQNAAAGPSTTLTYDPRKLFVIGEVNEKGHAVEYAYEYGTGTKLRTDGPNIRTCTTGCPPADATYPLKEQQLIRLDGMGRMIERYETVSHAGFLYTLYKVETNTYTEPNTAAAPPVPASVLHQQLVDVNTTTWMKDEVTLDGHGRPRTKTVFVQGSAPADAITTFTYRNDGTLQTVSVPDPMENTTATVTYSYGFDSLGRATSIRRPDSANNPSGVNIAYDGLTQTTSEVVGEGGGQVAVTRTVNDPFGRLIEVHEQTGSTTWATTTYAYGPDDRVATIVDPENVTTELHHDFAGHRTRITRHGRTWKYTYDRNGNMVAEQVPGSPDPLQDVLYTTTIVYDALDRPVSKVIGPRGLSAQDQAAFGNNTETFTYDTSNAMLGRLQYWYAYGPGATTPSVDITRTSDDHDRPLALYQKLNIAGYPQLMRWLYRLWNVSGGQRVIRYFDMVGGNRYTEVQPAYDARGLPALLRLYRTDEPARLVALQYRNVAGLVTKRRTPVDGTTSYIESNWTYDKLGRVVDQHVQKGPSGATIARQQLDYFGNDDPKTLRHHLGASSKLFTYAYDARHQLTGVTTDTTKYFGATYTYGDAGRFTRAQVTQTISPLPPGTEVQPRDVNYVYGGVDPEQVTALTKASNPGKGQIWASYTYDAAGNQLTRSYPGTGESWDYVYDGKDQLRRATKKLNGVIQGSEEYWYDHEGQRIAVVKRDAAGAKTEMIWFIGDTQAHYDANGTVTHVYSHLSLGTPVARVHRTADTTTSLELQFHGLANNTLAAVAEDGTSKASFSYGPFGEVLEAVDGGGPWEGVQGHKRRFNDKFEDDLTKLTYYGYRYYDKTLLGWTQADPLYRFEPDAAWVQPRKALLYTANLNNPIRYLDPDGRNPLAIPLIKGAIDVGTAFLAAAATAGAAVIGQALGPALAKAGPVDEDTRRGMEAGQQIYQAQVEQREVETIMNGMAADSAPKTDGPVQVGAKDSVAEPPPASGEGLLKPGPFAGESVPASGPRVTAGQKEKLTEIGKKTGCHSCGTKKFGTKSGKPVGDHQPATKLKKPGENQELYPQCTTCSGAQGAEVRKAANQIKKE